MTQGIYSIKDLEKLTGIKAHTIRIWEKRYQLIKPQRTSTNIRFYCDDDLKRLLNISILIRQGFKISHLAVMSSLELAEKVMNVSYKSSDADTQIEKMIMAMIQLDDLKFDKVISAATLNTGFEDTVIRIIYPFLERIGILWQTGSINPAQEHFVSNILRQKLLVAIDSHGVRPDQNAKRFLLFLRENELHELGLLFFSYLVKKSGNKILYLGQSVPFADLLAVSRIKEPDVLLTALVASMSRDEIHDYLLQLSENFKRQKIYVTGRQVINYNLPLPSNVEIIHNVSAFKEKLTKLN